MVEFLKKKSMFEEALDKIDHINIDNRLVGFFFF
jgi:hypothetical protein